MRKLMTGSVESKEDR